MGWLVKRRVNLDGCKPTNRFAEPRSDEQRWPALSSNVKKDKPRPPKKFVVNGLVMHLEPDPLMVQQLTNDVENVIDRLDQGSDYEHTVDDELGFMVDEHDNVYTDEQWETRQRSLNAEGTHTAVARLYEKQTSIQTKRIAYLMKAYYYCNSRLPEQVPPIQLYLETWTYILLAAHCSSMAYKKPINGVARSFGVGARSVGKNHALGTLTADDNERILLFYVKGTVKTSPRSWARALDASPARPVGFLDDTDNYCHGGFLMHAMEIIEPLAENIRAMLMENPRRQSYTLLFAGHSAGGAVVSLLYAHMLSSQLSNLNVFQNFFKRIHCITFGTPPISLLPLNKPPGRELHKWIFYSFLNEGDPVGRAQGSYFKSLAKLIASPVPSTDSKRVKAKSAPSSLSTFFAGGNRSTRPTLHRQQTPVKPYYPLATPMYTNAGRIIILRTAERFFSSAGVSRAADIASWEKAHISAVTAIGVEHEDIRDALWGDFYLHQMKVYLARVEFLSGAAMRQGRNYT